MHLIKNVVDTKTMIYSSGWNLLGILTTCFHHKIGKKWCTILLLPFINVHIGFHCQICFGQHLLKKHCSIFNLFEVLSTLARNLNLYMKVTSENPCTCFFCSTTFQKHIRNIHKIRKIQHITPSLVKKGVKLLKTMKQIL